MVGLDSNIFSYQFHQHPVFGQLVKGIFDSNSLGQLKIVTSILTITEILSVKAPPEKILGLQRLLATMPNILILDVSEEIAIIAASIRRSYGFRTPDAIQLATCVVAKANAFITNDKKLTLFKEVDVVPLQEFSARWKIAAVAAAPSQ